MKRKYISIQTESKIDDPVHPSTKAVGIDLGIKK
jgi:transposase